MLALHFANNSLLIKHTDHIDGLASIHWTVPRFSAHETSASDGAVVMARFGPHSRCQDIFFGTGEESRGSAHCKPRHARTSTSRAVS